MGSVACKVYIGTGMIAIGLFMAVSISYLPQQREALIGRKYNRLYETVVAVRQQLEERGRNLPSADGDRKPEEFQDRFQTILDEVRLTRPDIRIGIYSRELNSVVAQSPADAETLALNGPAMLSLDYPIRIDSNTPGYIWVTSSREDIEGAIGKFIINTALLTGGLWFFGLLIICTAFRRLRTVSQRVANNTGDELIEEAARDFPELNAILDTLADLRLNYKDELEKLGRIIDVCPVGILVVDGNGAILAANRLYRETFARSNCAIIGKQMGTTIPEACPQIDGWLTKALKGDGARERFFSCWDRDWIACTAPVWDETSGDVVGAVLIAQEITQYEQLRNTMHILDRTQLVSNMAAGVAHEIRNPLTVIKGYAQFLKQKAAGEMQDKFGLVLRESERVEHIITDFLTLASNKTMEKVPCDLNAIIHNTYPLLKENAFKGKCEIELKLAGRLPDLWADSQEIVRLIINLVRNGIEAHGDNGGIVTVSTFQEEEAVLLKVSDNGPGIPRENLEKIFDPFFTTKDNGTGLGLAIAASIVARHNGLIKVDSEQGQGTSVIVRFSTGDLLTEVGK
jgi:PAS domain S-box-containing protein